ncbi:MAG: endonuclease III [Mariprofundaceae bacterium]
MPRARVTRLFAKLQAENPQPVTELNYASDIELLLAVILSAQATDVGVNKATAKLYPVANTAQTIFDLGEEGLKRYISSIGLYNSKAKNIIKTCAILIHEHGGKVPDTRQALEELPGVGRKTANVVLNVLFGEPTIAVDTHLFRLANRIGLAPGKTPLIVEKGLEKAIPGKFMQYAHHWLILHGRYICTARKPKCHLCPIYDECMWVEKSGSC